MHGYSARDRETARKYGSVVKAAEITNRDYSYRYSEFGSTRALQRRLPRALNVRFLGYRFAASSRVWL
jgi:hypothetical protein